MFPTLRDLPALSAFCALVALLWFAVFRNDEYRAIVFDIVSHAAFWQIVCAGLVLFLAGAALAFWQSEKDA